jgi:hypothetical protein
MNKLSVRLVLFSAVVACLTSASGCGDDPVKPVDPPRITRFTAAPEDITPGDSSLLTYSVTGADSVKLLPDGIKLTPVTSGTHWAKPATPTLYSLLGYNKSGKDSTAVYVTMNGAIPVIEEFGLSEDTILTGDSTALLWRTIRADSIVINNGATHIADADSGGVIIKPTVSATLRAIAYNEIGADTATATVRVEIPYQVSSINGLYYKGTFGGGIILPGLTLQILDQASKPLIRPWLKFSVVEGDGTLSADSVLPGSGGIIFNDYEFDGQLGYGLVRAFVPGIDTIELKVRTSVIRFGADGQGQYVKLYDNYTDIVGLNGQPASVDHPEIDKPLYYINYESALGVVPIVLDVDEDGSLENEDPIVEIILNTVYTGTTLEGISVGSSIGAIRSAYGTPDVLIPDPADPTHALEMIYNTMGALFYLSKVTADSSTFEIHLWDPTTKSPGSTVVTKDLVPGRRLSRTASGPRD